MGVSLNENLSFSINQQYSKFDGIQSVHPIQILSPSEADNELILENELEDNKEQFTDVFFLFNDFQLVSTIEEHEFLLTQNAPRPQSLNILYCVLRI